jgi:hypothetical protein
MKLRALAAILVTGLVGLALACSNGAKSEKSSQTAAQTSATAAPTTAAAGEIGVPECDNYVSKYQQCIESKVPETMRDTMRQSFEQATAAWKQAAATPEARASLASACQQATDAARTAMQSYGCEF